MAKRSTDRVKAKMWAGDLTCEMDGPIAGVCVSLFEYLPDDETRQRVLDKLQAKMVTEQKPRSAG
jgi:hypothetical protein